MTTTHAAVAFLVSAGAVPAEACRLGADVPLARAATDADAGPDGVAWVSEKGLADRPGCLAAFGGALVVVPASADVAAVPAAATVVAADDPRIVFAILAGHLFADLLDAGWPAAGDSPIAPDAQIGEDVRLAYGVVLGAGVVLGRGVRVGPNTCIAHTTVEDGAEIGASCTIGQTGFGYVRGAGGEIVRFPHLGRVLIERGASVSSNTCIDRGSLGTTIVAADAKIDSLVYVSHNVHVGEGAFVVGHSMIGGSTSIGARAWIAPGSAVMDHVTVGADAVVGLGAVVTKSVAAGDTVAGSPARPWPPRTP